MSIFFSVSFCVFIFSIFCCFMFVGSFCFLAALRLELAWLGDFASSFVHVRQLHMDFYNVNDDVCTIEMLFLPVRCVPIVEPLRVTRLYALQMSKYRFIVFVNAVARRLDACELTSGRCS